MKNKFIILLIFTTTILFGQSNFHFNRDLPCVDKQFNLFVHAVNNTKYKTVTEDKMREAIERANEIFAPICISFKMCEMDTVFNYNYDILGYHEMKELSNLYVQHNRINVYVIHTTFFNPYIKEICMGSIDSMRNGNLFISQLNALPQVLGHFFGLQHTHKGSGEELVDGSNCKTAGDKICDTPADPYVFGTQINPYITGDCTFKSLKTDANGEYYTPDVTNVMSGFFYCHCKFSNEQYLKMAENYFKAAQKHW